MLHNTMITFNYDLIVYFNQHLPLQIQITMLISKIPTSSFTISLFLSSKCQQKFLHSSMLHSFAHKSIQSMKNYYLFGSQKKPKQKEKVDAEEEKVDTKQKFKSKFQQFEETLNKKSEKILKFLSSLNTKSYYKILRILIITLFPGSLTYLQFFGGNAVSSEFQKKIKERKQNLQVFKGKKVEQLMNQKQKTELQSAEKQLAIFQSHDYDYKQKLNDLLQLDDSKLINLCNIAFLGSAVGTNLKRLAWNMIQKSQDTQEKTDKKIFKNIYYVNMKEPCIYSMSKDEDSYWEEARDLNFLLSSIIGSSHNQPATGLLQQIKAKIMNLIYGKEQQTKFSQNKSILITDEVQILQHFLKDPQKKKKLEQLYQKLSYVQRKRNVRVFMIANNNSFFNRFNRQLQNPNLEDFKYEYITQMSDDNNRNIILCRGKIKEFYRQYPQLQTKLGPYFDKIVDFIVQNNNNTKQIMRILKDSKLDFKDVLKNKNLSGYLFWKKSKEDQLRQWIEKAEKQIKKQFQKAYFIKPMAKNKEYDHYLALKKIRSRIVKTSQEFMQQKKRIIIDQIDQSSQKTYYEHGPTKEEIINSKMAILMLIFSKNFEKDKDNQYFLYSMNKSQALAQYQLNKAQVIHGLNFSSKAYQQAFYQILEEHKQSFKKLLPNSQKEFNNQIRLHRESIKKHNREVNQLQQRLEKQFVKKV